MSQIAEAVEHLREAAMDRAEQETEKHIDRMIETLETEGWDLGAIAPYPKGIWDKKQYRQMKAKRHAFQSITKSSEARAKARGLIPHSRESVNLVELAPEKIEKVIAEAREDAAFQYDQFIAKLEKKIGATKSARLEGEHVWGYSFLFVTTEDGEEQIWKTQMIINFSKYGKAFNQWPTRKVKNVG